mgnify:CR=1 FL=1
MPKRTRRRTEPCRLNITPKAVEQLRSIQQENSSDPSHVMRLEAESEGFSLWLGPEVAGDRVLGSEETYQLRVSPEQAAHMAGENLIIDLWDGSPVGPCLIVYREEEPPPHLKPSRIRRASQSSPSGKQKRSLTPGSQRRKTAKTTARPGGTKRTASKKVTGTRTGAPKKGNR